MKNGFRTIGCEVIAALVKAPRTIRDIHEMVGCSHVTVSYWLRDLHESGLVRISGHIQRPYETVRGHCEGGRFCAVYEWQSSPFALPDVSREEADVA